MYPLVWSNAHKLPVLGPFSREFHVTVALRVQGVIPPEADIDACVKLRAALTHENISRNHQLAAKCFDAQSLGLGIATIFGTSACFFMCHFGLPVC
jgi:hypothetical protein